MLEPLALNPVGVFAVDQVEQSGNGPVCARLTTSHKSTLALMVARNVLRGHHAVQRSLHNNLHL